MQRASIDLVAEGCAKLNWQPSASALAAQVSAFRLSKALAGRPVEPIENSPCPHTVHHVIGATVLKCSVVVALSLMYRTVVVVKLLCPRKCVESALLCQPSAHASCASDVVVLLALHSDVAFLLSKPGQP